MNPIEVDEEDNEHKMHKHFPSGTIFEAIKLTSHIASPIKSLPHKLETPKLCLERVDP